MAWTIPSDRLTGDVITAAQWNTFLGLTGDMSMTAAAIVTTNGDTVYATAANTLARRAIGSTGQVLTVAGGIPTWAAAAGDVVLAGSSSAATSTTSTSAVDLVTISGLSIATTSFIEFSYNTRKLATAANSTAFGFKANSTVVFEAAGNGVGGGHSSTLQAEDGMAYWSITPRSTANYVCGVEGFYRACVTATGASSVTAALTAGLTAPMPFATITSMAIRAINNTNSNTVEMTALKIWTK